MRRLGVPPKIGMILEEHAVRLPAPLTRKSEADDVDDCESAYQTASPNA